VRLPTSFGSARGVPKDAQRTIGSAPIEYSAGGCGSASDDEEKIIAGRPDANMPALLTKDVPGGSTVPTAGRGHG